MLSDPLPSTPIRSTLGAVAFRLPVVGERSWSVAADTWRMNEISQLLTAASRLTRDSLRPCCPAIIYKQHLFLSFHSSLAFPPLSHSLSLSSPSIPLPLSLFQLSYSVSLPVSSPCFLYGKV